MTTKPKEIKTTKKADAISVKDYMTKDLELLAAELTLEEAAEKMRDLNTGSLPIGADDKLIGFVTDRDIVVRAIAEGLDPKSTTVNKIMTKPVLYCYENNELGSVLDNMTENHVLRLVVLNENKRLKGVITHSQIAKAAIDRGDEKLYKKVTTLSCYDKIW